MTRRPRDVYHRWTTDTQPEETVIIGLDNGQSGTGLLQPNDGDSLETIRSGCTECGACVSQCAFLQKHGTPRAIAEAHLPGGDGNRTLTFECSLCSLCSAVCPEGLDPAEFFLALRGEASARGETDFSPYKGLLRHESLGGSRLLAYYGLPRGCRTVLFPGYALPGTRPETTWLLFWHLRRHIPDLGIVLDCCGKPSHDLGRTRAFEARFRELLNKLARAGVRKVILASYQLVPPGLVDTAALAIPGLEVILSLGLVLDVRGSLAGITGMLLVFCLVLWLGIVRGLEIDCGCFSTGEIRKRNALERAFYRDLIMLAGIVYLYVWRFVSGHRPRSLVSLHGGRSAFCGRKSSPPPRHGERGGKALSFALRRGKG